MHKLFTEVTQVCVISYGHFCRQWKKTIDHSNYTCSSIHCNVQWLQSLTLGEVETEYSAINYTRHCLIWNWENSVRQEASNMFHTCYLPTFLCVCKAVARNNY